MLQVHIHNRNTMDMKYCIQGSRSDYLKVKEFAVSSVDDVGCAVRVGDIYEIYLPKEEMQS